MSEKDVILYFCGAEAVHFFLSGKSTWITISEEAQFIENKWVQICQFYPFFVILWLFCKINV